MILQNLIDTGVLQGPEVGCQCILQCRAEVTPGYLQVGGDQDQSYCRELGSVTALGCPSWIAEIRVGWDISPEFALLKHIRDATISNVCFGYNHLCPLYFFADSTQKGILKLQQNRIIPFQQG